MYYITKVLIPPLERIFNLVGADVRQWFNEMPRTIVPELVSPRKPARIPTSSNPNVEEVHVLNGHFSSTQCLSCGEPGSQCENIIIYYGQGSDIVTPALCEECCDASAETLANLNYRIKAREERLKSTHDICVSCTNVAPSDFIHCESLDCQWFYARRKAQTGMELVPLLAEMSEELEDAMRQLENAEEDDSAYGISDMEDAGLYALESPAVEYVEVDDDDDDMYL